MNFLELTAILGLDKDNYDKGLDEASGKASSFAKGIGNIAKVATGAFVATTAATVAGTKAFIDGVSSVASYGDSIDKMSQKMNMSATAYQEWDFIMQHAGASIESMQAGIKTLSSAAETGNEAFEKLGITEEQIAEMSGEELFEATITALQGVEDETQRTYLAGQLLGRGATELGALLNMSAEETEEMRTQVHELGGVLSDDAVKNAARFQDSLQNMQTAFDGVKNSLLSNFLPSFSTVMDGLALVFSGDSDSGLGMVEAGVEDLAENISKVAPMFIRVGGTILQALATSIAENAPTLIESGIEAVGKFIDGIIDNADGIFEVAEKIITMLTDKLVDPTKAAKFTQTAINLIVKLANGISQALPQLIPAVAKVIAEIIRTLTNSENLGMLIQCALQLIMALAIGLVDAIPEIVKIIPEVIVNIIIALVENFPLIVETLLELIGALGMSVFNLIGGLLGMDSQEIQDSVTQVFNNLVAWGANVLSWLTNGVQNITNKVSSFFNNVKSFFSNGFSTISSNVSNFFNNVRNFFTNGFNNIRNNVENSLNNIKDKFIGIFDNVKNVVQNAINYIKGLFDFNWSLPDIKLPHFSISGSFDLLASPPKIPSVSVSWYKKAMEQPYLLDGATIFGAAGGKLLGGGESGSELVVGTNKLMGMIRQAVGVNGQPIVINVYGAEGQDIRLLAKEVSKELQNLINDKEKVYA